MARKLKFGSPAWRKKFMKNAGKKKAAKKNAPRKKKHALRPKAKRKPAARKNPPKPRMHKLTAHGTGWIRARKVKIVRNRGRVEILVERPRRKSRSK